MRGELVKYIIPFYILLTTAYRTYNLASDHAMFWVV